MDVRLEPPALIYIYIRSNALLFYELYVSWDYKEDDADKSISIYEHVILSSEATWFQVLAIRSCGIITHISVCIYR